MNVRITLILCLILVVPACKKGGGSSGPDVNDHLTGNRHVVSWKYFVSADEHESGNAALYFNGDTGYSRDLTGPTLTNRQGVISGGMSTGAYAVGVDGQTVRVDSVFSGGFTPDANFMVLSSDSVGSSPGMIVSFQRGGVFSTVDLSGFYHVTTIAYDLAGSARSVAYGILNFDGFGTWTGTVDINSEGVVAVGQAVNGTYSVNGDGNLVFNAFLGAAQQTEGAIFIGGTVAIAGSSNAGNDPRMLVMVEQAAGMMNADLNGLYFLSGFSAGATNTSIAGTITFDGVGGFSRAYTSNDEGSVTTGNTDTGTYVLAADGTVTLTVTGGDPVYKGAVRTGGALGVAADVTSSHDPALLAFTRK